jgi:probable HAF family extracellular repeat protein
MVGLGDLPGGNFFSRAYDISGDGEVIVGLSISSTEIAAFRLTSSTGMVSLGDLPGGSSLSAAYAVSDDGTTIVGYGSNDDGQVAMRWTSVQGMINLGDLPGGPVGSEANDVSANGRVIVGDSRVALSSSRAFLWTEQLGMVNLQELLAAKGVSEVAGWVLTNATAVSADGRTIVGNGRNPDGLQEAWIATVPEPPSYFLAALGMILVVALQTRQRAASRRQGYAAVAKRSN